MGSIGKLQAALTAATNEVTVAAANLNFDFTLIKCEAPKEFHQLGSALSQRRKDDAEYGSTHVTARRLGALFDGFLPSTPNLLRAYGTRVSEIAQASRESGSPEPSNSMFAAHAGIDGTSIWAAATSSPTALHVQLLACMLARVWKANEATSIWVELVKGRRKEIEDKWNQNYALPYPSLVSAAQAEISRASLAEWDASARAWLRTADRVKVKSQDQLMILVANVNVPINEEMMVYQSVITAWKSALDSIEKLTSGMPQASNHGPCLLALSSWHLYPDIILMGQTAVSHRFDDPLVRPGGTLTLGLARPGGLAHKGVFWSLSLAHLNFYGRRPVEREAALDLQSHKLTFQQLMLAVFGAFLAHWGVSGPSAEGPARFFIDLKESIQTAAGNDQLKHGSDESHPSLVKDGAYTISLFATAATAFLEARKFEDELVLRLITLGGKKASKLLPNKSPMNFMGLCDPGILLSVLKGPDERITFLRRILFYSDSPALTQEAPTYLIRFFGSDGAFMRAQWRPNRIAGIATGKVRQEALPQGGLFEEAHVRWAPQPLLQGGSLYREVFHEIPHDEALHLGSQRKVFILEDQYDGIEKEYRYIYGDPVCAAIYVNTALVGMEPVSLRQPNIEDLIWCLEFDLIDIQSVLEFFDGVAVGLSSEGRTLRALNTAHEVYRALPTATVSTRALNYPLYSPHWSSSHSGSQVERNEATFDVLKNRGKTALRISQNVAFACVAWLEAGVDIDPPSLERVFAIAYEDSIYVSMQLTCDPWEVPNSYELKRVAGNVGKPGITLLVPPDDPVVPISEESSWRVLSISNFNGLAEDHFSKTSMHLSFTEYYVPLIQAGDEQGQDSRVYFLESVVSIHHAGEWIGDVDIQKCLRSMYLTRALESSCDDNHTANPQEGIRSIESWEDIIDPPPGDCIIRAHGNWVARLASTAVLLHLRKAEGADKSFGGVVIFANDSCWGCLAKTHLRNSTAHLPRYGLLTSDLPSSFKLMIY